MTTRSGRSTAIARGARRFRSSRTASSSSATSTMFSRFATPIRARTRGSPRACSPRRRRPTIVGIRGSSQPRHEPLLHELQQLALAHHRVGEVEAGELDLARLARHRQVVHRPVVERPVILELQRAERVRDVLDGVRDGMRVVVHRVDAPRVARTVVRRVPDAVDHRVAQVDVRRRHVDLRPEHLGAVFELAVAHPLEQVEALRDRPVAPRALAARLGERAAVFPDLLGRQLVHVGLARLDEADRVVVDLLEVIGRVVEPILPVEAEPVNAVDDRVNVLDVFLGRVRVVEAQVAGAAELLRRRRSSGRSTLRARCAGSRWARAENGSERWNACRSPGRPRRFAV